MYIYRRDLITAAKSFINDEKNNNNNKNTRTEEQRGKERTTIGTIFKYTFDIA